MTTTAQQETDDAPTNPPSARRISIGTICCFLIGGRDAIVNIAQSRSALWLGLIFVLSAGFAREQDEQGGANGTNRGQTS